MRKTLLIAKPNAQGYIMNLIMSRTKLHSADYEAHFSNAKDLREAVKLAQELCQLEQKPTPDVGAIFFVGFPYWESQENSIPFQSMSHIELYHFATFGDNRQAANWHSYVDEATSPVGHAVEALNDLGNRLAYKVVEPHDMADTGFIIDRVNAYNDYTFDPTEKPSGLDLVELADFYKGDLPKVLRYVFSEVELEDELALPLKALRSSRKSYLQQAINRTQASVINGTVICFLYAERYQNEIAHSLIDFYRSHNYQKVLVFVGRHTKGDDVFSVRSFGVDASSVVYQLNRGKGKPTTATVFLGKAGDATYQATLQQLSEIL